MIKVQASQIIGWDHTARQTNSQDSYAVVELDEYVVGVVCDGCGSGDHSEVGAKLASQYVATQAAQMLDSGATLDDIPHELYYRTLSFLDYLIASMQPANRAAFVQHHLLFTVLGVIASEKEAIMFSAGDGTIAVDDTIMEIDQHNTPAYIAYHLLDKALLGGFQMPDTFETYELAEWSRLAIASDGFKVSLVPQIWALPTSRRLQRQLNVWSMERHFKDDATIITLERIAEA